MTDKILVVEDDKQTRHLITNQLRTAGYAVVETSRGDKAIQLAIREKPDLVVLDIVLEGNLNGYSVARSLQSLDETKSCYIIFLSTKREVKDKVRGFATGAHDFISKSGFSQEEFLARIENGLRIKQTHDALLDRSNIDGLTELFNHRFFMDELKKEMEKAGRHAISLSLAYIDVDDFKVFNDSFGHYAGDRVLKKVSELVKKTCRNTDICARYGGEEFAIILPSTDLNGAQVVMERVRRSIEREDFPVTGSGEEIRSQRVTVSIGVASYAAGLSVQEFIELADKKALYRAKAAGKNRVYLFLGYDDDGREIIMDAIGRQPESIDVSGLELKLREVEAKLGIIGESELIEQFTMVKEAVGVFLQKLHKFHNKRSQESLNEKK